MSEFGNNDFFANFAEDDAWTLDFQALEKDAADLGVVGSDDGPDHSGQRKDNRNNRNRNDNDGDEEDSNFLESSNGRDVIHKRGLPLDLTRLVNVIYWATDESKRSRAEQFIQYLILFTYGKRNIRKDAVEVSKLSATQKQVYFRIRKELQNPVRKKRVLSFINQKDITKRLINYFVVHYSLVEKEISYYLDRRSYPYRIIGKFNEPNQPDILQLLEQGENIVWINFHQEYKNSKNKKGRRNLHAPYRRSISVQGDDGKEYSLCELNFYLWLDDVGGFEIFYLFEHDIRDKKAKYDEQKRIQENQPTYGKRKKRKVVLRNTDGRNYKSHLVQYTKPAPFSVMEGSCSYFDYVARLKSAQQEAQEEQQINFLDKNAPAPPSTKRLSYLGDPKQKTVSTGKRNKRKTPEMQWNLADEGDEDSLEESFLAAFQP